MAGLWTLGIDYKGQPLYDAWWTRGWTSQNDSYIQVPSNQFSAAGFPSNLTYINVVGNFYDSNADPLSGFFTFWPSSALTFNQSGQITYMPQRYSGTNQTLLGLNQRGDGKIYITKGQLWVTLLASDNANMFPATFTYHVKEHWFKGQQYDIFVPSADLSVSVDIHNLIIPGSLKPANEEVDENQEAESHVSIPVSSSQFLAADITAIAGGVTENPTSFPVDIAFIAGPTQPQSSDWISASWASMFGPPYIAQIMVGPNGHVLPPGTYKIWARVSNPPQVPVIPVGFVTIY